MKAEETYSVTTDGVASRLYKLEELVWLWRTAQLPDRVQYQSDNGEWRPVGELVEPIIAQQDAKTRNAVNHEPNADDRQPVKPRRPSIIAVAAALLVLGGFTIMRSVFEKPEEISPQAIQQENQARLDDTIESHGVIPRMTMGEVRKSLGEPKGVEWSNDPHKEMWRYREYRVYFESGVVSRLEPIR